MEKLRVWNVVNPPGKPYLFPVESPEEGARTIKRLAAQQLRDPNVYSNAFGLLVLEDGEWTEWYDEEGRDVDEAFGEER